jgi:S1-C subfamily serine protease
MNHDLTLKIIAFFAVILIIIFMITVPCKNNYSPQPSVVEQPTIKLPRSKQQELYEVEKYTKKTISHEEDVKPLSIATPASLESSTCDCKGVDGSKVFSSIKDAVVMISVDSRWQGTGFFINKEGYICTAAHVITNVVDKKTGKLEPSKNIYVLVSPSYEVYKCRIVGFDGAGDIGVLKVDEKDPYNKSLPSLANQPYLDFDPSAKTGELAYVLGYPLGTDLSSFSMGIVRNEKFVAPSLFMPFNLILITCPAYQGNSGSPIVNANGKVIGLLTFVYFSKDQTYESIGGGPCCNIVNYVTEKIIQGDKGNANPHFDPVTKRFKKGFFGMGPCRMVWFSDIPNLIGRYQFPQTRPIGFRGSNFKSQPEIKVPTTKKVNHFDEDDIVSPEQVAVAPVAAAPVAAPVASPAFKQTDIIVSINGQDIGALPDQLAPGTILWKTVPDEVVTVKYYELGSDGRYSSLKSKQVKLDEYPDGLDSFEGRALKVEITCTEESCSLISGLFEIPEPEVPIGF